VSSSRAKGRTRFVGGGSGFSRSDRLVRRAMCRVHSGRLVGRCLSATIPVSVLGLFSCVPLRVPSCALLVTFDDDGNVSRRSVARCPQRDVRDVTPSGQRTNQQRPRRTHEAHEGLARYVVVMTISVGLFCMHEDRRRMGTRLACVMKPAASGSRCSSVSCMRLVSSDLVALLLVSSAFVYCMIFAKNANRSPLM
jgi:hypothetical protein